jgi:hypothetical protein
VDEDSLKSFFEKMFWETNMIAPANAIKIPKILPWNSTEQASITPTVNGIRERYVPTE